MFGCRPRKPVAQMPEWYDFAGIVRRPGVRLVAGCRPRSSAACSGRFAVDVLPDANRPFRRLEVSGPAAANACRRPQQREKEFASCSTTFEPGYARRGYTLAFA